MSVRSMTTRCGSWIGCAFLCASTAALPGCGSAAAPQSLASHPVAAAPPPQDDGKPAKGGQGGEEHAAALEQLAQAPLGPAVDRQRSLRVLLPDSRRWLRVKFWGAQSLVAFRYGKDHHAIVGGFVVHVDDETTPGACSKTFEHWAEPWVEAFDVAIEHDPPAAFPWNGKIADLDSLVATTATLGMHDDYAVAYALYPAWKGACLVLGVAVPARGELERAKAVRDRFSKEVLPALQVTSASEPPERY